MSYCSKRENKIRCLLHYFERVCQCMPTGFVSFERKVLPRGHKHNPHYVSYPEAEYWAKSTTPLCSVEVTSKHSQLNPFLLDDFVSMLQFRLAGSGSSVRPKSCQIEPEKVQFCSVFGSSVFNFSTKTNRSFWFPLYFG